MHEVAPGEVTAAPLSRVLPDVLKEAGYARIACFDLLNGFRGLEPNDGSYLSQLGLTPTNGTAPGGIDLLSSTLERHIGAEGTPSALIVDFASRLVARNEALSPPEHHLFSRALILSHAARARPAGDKRLPFFNTVTNTQIRQCKARRLPSETRKYIATIAYLREADHESTVASNHLEPPASQAN